MKAKKLVRIINSHFESCLMPYEVQPISYCGTSQSYELVDTCTGLAVKDDIDLEGTLKSVIRLHCARVDLGIFQHEILQSKQL